MTLLPVVQRELLEASRRRGTHRMRLGIATVGLLIGGWIMLIPFLRTPQELGMTLFISLAVTAYLYSLLIGIFRTADCLSEEKRDGTLGLLFLTDLKGYDIVLGKLAATSLNAFYGLLALFPVLAIPLLVGGVTFNEFWRVVLVALNNMFFSLAVGMFCSAISRDERKAMGLALLILLIMAVGVPVLGAIIDNWRVTRGWKIGELIAVPAPTYGCLMAFDDMRRGAGTRNFFTVSVATVHALGWLLLMASALIVPRTWQDKGTTPAGERRRERANRLWLGSPEKRRILRRRWLDLNPVYWLIARERLKPVGVWLFLGLGAFIWMLGLIFNPNDWKDEVAYVWTALLAHTVLKLWLATESCRRFSSDRQSGALELMLSTPLPVRSIIRGQTMALERQFALPVCVVLLADFIFLLNMRNDKTAVIGWLVLMVVFVADMLALAWVGMWRGLNSRRPNRAATVAVTQIMVLPWVLFGALLTFLGVSGAFRGATFGSGEVVIFLGLAVALAVNAAFVLPARQGLLSEFRRVATARFEIRRPGG